MTIPAVKVSPERGIQNTTNRSCISDAVRLFKTTFKFFGYYSPFLAFFTKPKETEGANKYLRVLHFVYSVFLSSTLTIITVRFILSTNRQMQNGISSTLMFSFASISFYCSCAYFSWCSTWTFSRTIDRLCEDLKDYERAFHDVYKSVRLNRIIRNILVVSVITAAVDAVAMGIITRIMAKQSAHLRVFLFSGTSSGITAVISSAILVIVAFPLCFQFFAPEMFLAVTLYILHQTSACLMSRIYNLRTSGHSEFENNINNIRQQFEAFVQLMCRYNEVILHIPPIDISLSISVTCFMLYGIVNKGDLASEDFAISIIVMITVLMKLILLITGSILLKQKIYEPLDHLYILDVTKLSDKAAREVQLFISRLSGEPIGISVYGLFVIDKSTILMLLGTILTYAVVILQMKPDGSIAELKELITSFNCSH